MLCLSHFSEGAHECAECRVPGALEDTFSSHMNCCRKFQSFDCTLQQRKSTSDPPKSAHLFKNRQKARRGKEKCLHNGDPNGRCAELKHGFKFESIRNAGRPCALCVSFILCRTRFIDLERCAVSVDKRRLNAVPRRR